MKKEPEVEEEDDNGDGEEEEVIVTEVYSENRNCKNIYRKHFLDLRI